MPRVESLYEWTAEVTRRMPGLSRCQAALLAEYSYGMALAHSCSLTAVALAVAALLKQGYWTARQRLRELYLPAGRKRGECRSQLDPELCFGPLLDWVTGDWTGKRLAIALDPTHLKDKFIVLTVSALYRGCGVPVAWAIVRADQKGGWNEIWARLLKALAGRFGEGWEVFVLTDRGLESGELFRAIVSAGWHPLMRAKGNGHFRPAGWHKFRPMKAFCPRVGDRFAAAGEAYAGSDSRLACTLMAEWGAGHEAAWLILTDLPPGSASACWYAFRTWIEQNFKVIKRAGWQWQNTRMEDPERAERLWVAVAVATLWLIAVGGVASGEVPAETVPKMRLKIGKRGRIHRLFRVGLLALMAALTNGHPLPETGLEPEKWPAVEPPAPCPAEQEWIENQNTYP